MSQNSNSTVYSYRVDEDATTPFAGNKPSGSDWGQSQLSWFGIDNKRDCTLQEIAPGNIELMPYSKISSHIRKNLDKNLGDIEALGLGVNRETFYGALLNLLDFQEPVPSYATSAFASSPQAAESQGPSPARIARPKAPLTPTPLFAEPPATPRGPARTNQIVISPTVYPSRAPVSTGWPVIASSMYPSRAAYDGDGAPVGHGTPSPSSSWSSSLPPSPTRDPRTLSNVDGDSSEAPDQFAAGPSQLATERLSASRIRKLEIDVELTAGAFLSVINNGLVAGANAAIEKTFTSAAMDLHVGIHKQKLSTRPDRYMWIRTCPSETDEATLAELFTECKREKHGKKEHEIFGQEFAHLLGAAERKKETGKRLGDGEYYMTYLISWHYITAYVSRLDMSAEQFIKLKSGDRHCLEGTRVKRSQVLNITKGVERMQLAEFIARIMIRELSVYRRHRRSGLVRRLQGLE